MGFVSTMPKRYLIALLACFGYMNMFCLRTNLSMAIVEMAEGTSILLDNGTYVTKAEFNWSSQQKSIVLSAFSYGYIFTLGGGIIVNMFGGATVFGLGIALTAVTTLITPFLIYYNFYLFLISRVLEGLFEATLYSSMSELWSRWAPPEERSRLVSFSFTGIYIGLTISYPISGFVASVWGWPAIFYSTGGIALLWSVIWLVAVANDPADDKHLSDAERVLLQNNIKRSSTLMEVHYPWRSILTSKPVWTLCVVQFVFSCGYTIVSVYLPIYIKDISHINIGEIGVLSSLPHFCAAVSHPVAGFLADKLRNNKILTTTQVHKLYICCGFLAGAVLLNVAAFWPSFVGVIICLCLFRFITSFCDVTFHVNAIDLAPQYSSLLLGISTSFFTLAAIVSPIIIGCIVQHQSRVEWNICFIIYSVFYTFGAVLFGLFASGELQPWAYSHCETNEMEEKNVEKK